MVWKINSVPCTLIVSLKGIINELLSQRYSKEAEMTIFSVFQQEASSKDFEYVMKKWRARRIFRIQLWGMSEDNNINLPSFTIIV